MSLNSFKWVTNKTFFKIVKSLISALSISIGLKSLFNILNFKISSSSSLPLGLDLYSLAPIMANGINEFKYLLYSIISSSI